MYLFTIRCSTRWLQPVRQDCCGGCTGQGHDRILQGVVSRRDHGSSAGEGAAADERRRTTLRDSAMARHRAESEHAAQPDRYSHGMDQCVQESHPRLLVELVDVATAEATNPADKKRILNDVEEGAGGIEGLNVAVRGCVY